MKEEIQKQVVCLIEEVMQQNDGKESKENVIFSEKAKGLIKEIAEYAKTTTLYKRTKERREEFWEMTKDATPALVYGYMLDRVANAPTRIHAESSIILLMPRLDEVLNGGTENGTQTNNNA